MLTAAERAELVRRIAERRAERLRARGCWRVFTARLSERDAEWLGERAYSDGVSAGAVVRELLEDAGVLARRRTRQHRRPTLGRPCSTRQVGIALRGLEADRVAAAGAERGGVPGFLRALVHAAAVEGRADSPAAGDAPPSGATVDRSLEAGLQPAGSRRARSRLSRRKAAAATALRHTR